MNGTTKTALAILGVALALGVLGDALLRATPWGVNVVLWVAPLLAAVIGLARRHRIALTGGGRWLIAPAIFFALAFVWRDSATMNFLNLLALLLLLALIALRARAGRVRVAGLTEYAQGILAASIGSMIGVFELLIDDIEWKRLPRGNWSRQVGAVGRGLLIALPLLFMFGGLFAAADAVFEDIVIRLFDWDIDELFVHGLSIFLWAVIAGGFLKQTLLRSERITPGQRASLRVSLGRVEIGTVLGLVNLLFLAFVLVQVGYFFGGREVVESSINLTYAEYARRGFFELVTVAALTLPMLLIAHAMLSPDDPAAESLFRLLSAALIALLFVIMYSAVERMLLYQSEFGLTELRLYTSAFMAWLAMVFGWFAATVLRGRRDRFAFGALMTGLAVIVGLHVVNPDDLIARVNTSRVDAPIPLDARYVASLSADSVPALIESLPSMGESNRCLVAAHLLARWLPPEDPDWRTWNLSRARAWQAVELNRSALQELACPAR